MRRVLGDVTTGFPKGAMHTHENVLATIETAFRVVRMPPDIGSELRALVVVPLVHVIGCHSQTLPALRTGGTAVTDASFDGRRMIEILRRERITSGTAVPAIYYHILNQPRFAPANVAAVHWACYGGAPIAPRSCAGSLSSSRTHLSATTRADQIDVDLDPAAARMAAEHADSVGFAAPHTDVAIGDADPDSGIGEILIRGQGVCAGYWNKPEATAQTFVDHWLHTATPAGWTSAAWYTCWTGSRT